MGKKNITKCEDLIKNFKRGDEIGFIKLQQLISINIGSDPRTISNTLRTMLDIGLIKDIGLMHFKIL